MRNEDTPWCMLCEDQLPDRNRSHYADQIISDDWP